MIQNNKTEYWHDEQGNRRPRKFISKMEKNAGKRDRKKFYAKQKS